MVIGFKIKCNRKLKNKRQNKILAKQQQQKDFKFTEKKHQEIKFEVEISEEKGNKILDHKIEQSKGKRLLKV